VLEPAAAGAGHLVRELRRGCGLEVVGSDLYSYEGSLVPDIGVRGHSDDRVLAGVQIRHHEFTLPESG
jgi:hypothetical protein